ncbi:MAG: CoA transferase [Nitrospinota bacterium]
MLDSHAETPAADPSSSGANAINSDPLLSGLKVLDLTQVIAGPFCTTMLANLGAEVVKLEPPGRGDEMRNIGRYEGREDHEDYFNANNNSKKSIELNLKNPLHQQVAYELAKCTDVVVENFAPGTADKLGMGWKDLHPLNSRLIYCSISGFGQTGPYRNRLGIDSVIQGISGVMSVTGFPDGVPTIIGAPLSDVVSGMYAAYTILGALHRGKRDGQGCYIDISMQASMLAVLGPRMGETLQVGVSPERIGNENPMRVPSDTYQTKDGRFLNITVVNERHWAPFCRALKREEWIDDSRFATMRLRAQNRKELGPLVAARFAEETIEELLPRLEEARLPFAPVNDYAQAADDQQIAHREMIHNLSHPVSGHVRVVGPPWLMTGKQVELKPPPLLGQHTEEILGSWLGWNTEEINRFRIQSAEKPGGSDGKIRA